MLMCLADWFTRLGDRILFGRPAPTPRSWTMRRYHRLVAARCVVDVPPPALREVDE